VASVESDEALTLAAAAAAAEPSAESAAATAAGALAAAAGIKADVKFDVLGRVDQGAVFERVVARLAAGHCMGIFPEGGSSDRSWFSPGELLDLKPGVAIIAMEALHKHKLAVPIVPVGMQYFEGDKFRGRCVIEFGAPIVPREELLAEYAEDKARGGHGASATTKLLEAIEDGMRGCLVEAPSYEELELVYMARRLFVRGNKLGAAAKQDLNRRFATWYGAFYLAKKKANEPVPPEIDAVRARIAAYRDSLKLLGLRDYQVRHLEGVPMAQVLGTIAHLLVVCTLASVPMLLLNLPVGLFARATADAHVLVALKGSNVKVAGRDVRLSKMITVCMAGVPLLWLSYAAAMRLLLGCSTRQTLLYLFWCPFFSYLAVVATEAGMVDLKDLKPLLLRLMVSRAEMLKLVETRRGLQLQVRSLVKAYGPQPPSRALSSADLVALAPPADPPAPPKNGSAAKRE
jgi:glycerol-3-phosphate O-acyltransferase/dihydroxyacetone phosphate acyltransferase